VKLETRRLEESAKLLERAKRVIPAYTQTLSKNPTQWVQGVAPAYVSRAEGAHVWDVDGNRYLDFPMALGPILLGYGHPAVNLAIERQLRDGIVFTLPHPLEVEVAERIVELVPCADRIRFAKTGSDATTASVRLARACTGRDGVIVCGYHGWQDWYIGTTSRSIGVPESVQALSDSFTFNDLDSLDAALSRQGGGTAAVVLEPVGADEPAEGFLEGVVERAHAAGALAVFDEIITGFRLAPGGAQERYGVVPDLAAFGKALGNGMPISALVGRAEYMDRLEDVFFSGTHGGEALSLAAARAVLDELTPEFYEGLFSRGERLRAGVREGIDEVGVAELVTIGGAAPRTVTIVREPDGSDRRLLARSIVQQELLKRGVLFNGSNFISAAHTDEDIDHAVQSYREAFAVLGDALRAEDLAAALEGPPVQPAFRALS
jgi:glutamate-1-semialdehyde aminotransferase